MAIVKCTHCGGECDGRLTLAIHLCSLRVNQLACPWPFCTEDCRASWFEEATSEHLFTVAQIPDGLPREDWPLDLHDQDGQTMLAVIHHDGGEDRFRVVIHTAQAPTVIAGNAIEVHSFEHPHHINAWWTGAMDHEPMIDPVQTEKEGSR